MVFSVLYVPHNVKKFLLTIWINEEDGSIGRNTFESTVQTLLVIIVQLLMYLQQCHPGSSQCKQLDLSN